MSFKKGIIESTDGEFLGSHNGLVNYTIGQRKGLGVGGIKGQEIHKPLYVVDIDIKNNKVIVGTKEKLQKYLIHLKDINFCSNILPNNSFKARIKIRSNSKPVDGKVKIFSNQNNCIVELSSPEIGVAPGQACVFYNSSKKMIGGGWISAGEKKII